MTKSSTQNDLIRYIYQEMTEYENEQFVHTMQKNPVLMQEYIDMLGTIDHLDRLILNPSEKIVRAIKRKAQSKGLEKV
jgi:hypothetical protein